MEIDASPSAPQPARSVAAARGLEWVTEAWPLFAGAPGPWVLFAVIGLGILLLCSFVPVVGTLASPFASTLIGAGMMLAARRQQEGQRPEVADLFAVLSHRALKPLLLVTLIYVGIAFAAGVVLFGVFGIAGGAMALLGGTFGGTEAAAVAGIGSMLLGLLVYLAVMVPILAMYWFAVPLVLFRDAEPWAAMVASLKAVVANLLPMLVYGVICLVLAALATLPFMLGWLVALPLIAISWLRSYQDVFP